MTEAATKKRPAFLAVREVAEELGGMSTSGVYKLIQRGRLKAVRKSERKLVVPVPALRAYQARLAGKGPSVEMPRATGGVAAARTEFERDAGATPERWLSDWKGERIEDSPENMARAIQALSILAATEQTPPAADPAREPIPPPPLCSQGPATSKGARRTSSGPRRRSWSETP